MLNEHALRSILFSITSLGFLLSAVYISTLVANFGHTLAMCIFIFLWWSYMDRATKEARLNG